MDVTLPRMYPFEVRVWSEMLSSVQEPVHPGQVTASRRGTLPTRQKLVATWTGTPALTAFTAVVGGSEEDRGSTTLRYALRTLPESLRGCQMVKRSREAASRTNGQETVESSSDNNRLESGGDGVSSKARVEEVLQSYGSSHLAFAWFMNTHTGLDDSRTASLVAIAEEQGCELVELAGHHLVEG